MSPLWLILDVETTGLDPATAGVWQLGAVLWEEGREIDALEILVRPEAHHWTEEHRARARAKSGLTEAEEALLRLPSFPGLPAALRVLLLWIYERQPSAVIATSYNLPFEQAFLDNTDCSLSILAYQADVDLRWGPCLMATAAKALTPGKPRLSLEKACAALGLPWSGSHRALADARLAAQVGARLGMFTREEEQG